MFVTYFAGSPGANAQLVCQPGIVFEDEDAASFVTGSQYLWDGTALYNSIQGGQCADEFEAVVRPIQFASGANIISFLQDGTTQFAPQSTSFQADSDEYNNFDGDDDDGYVSRGTRDLSPPDLGVPHYNLNGVSRDSAAAALAACVVRVFDTQTNAFVSQMTSDGVGNFSFNLFYPGPFYMVAYKAGSPDIAGTTVNTLVPVAQ